MGSTTSIKETNIGASLIGKTCDDCSKIITQKDALENNNWQVEFDTSNDVKLEDNKIKGYGYNLTIWIRNAYHENCHDAEEYLKEEKEKKAQEKQKTPYYATGSYSKSSDGSFQLKEKKSGLYGIDLVMDRVLEAQKNHVERMKAKEQE